MTKAKKIPKPGVYLPGVEGDLQESGIEAESFEALAAIACEQIRQRGKSLSIVCGPISTGGAGHQMWNLQIFNAVVAGLQRLGIDLFDQVPYEFGLRRLANAWHAEGHEGYCMPILDVFYREVFECGYINRAYFLPGWTSSTGAKWERRHFDAAGVPVFDVEFGVVEAFLKTGHEPAYVAQLMAALRANCGS